MATPADGRLLDITTNTELFSLIGDRFGGDGVNTFAVPKLAPLKAGDTVEICTTRIVPPRPE